MQSTSKPRLLYILPKDHKDMDVLSLSNSLNTFFDGRIITDDTYFENIKNKKISYIGEVKDTGIQDYLLPFSIIAADRFLLDYSNIGSIEKKFNTKTYFCYYEKIIKFIDDFQPDLIVTQVCDNSLSATACIAAERKGIFFCSEFVRPYLENRQILINSRSFDNQQIKRIAKTNFHALPIGIQIQSKEIDDYNRKSTYWSPGSKKKDFLSKKIIKSLQSYIKLYGLKFIFRFIFSKLMERRFKNILPEENVILMPLHLQPEAVFLGTDNRNSDQAAVINYISFNLPINYQLVVKEHWAQKARPISFYRKILKLKNVTPLSKSYDIQAAIDASQIVIVVSGNAGFEALKQGKKVILFGQAFYDECPNCYRFKGQEPLYSFFERVITAQLVEKRLVDNYIACLETAALENSVEIPSDRLGSGAGANNAGERLIKLFSLYKNNIETFGTEI